MEERHEVRVGREQHKEVNSMNVMLDDEYDWMLLRNDGRIFDTMGNEVKWIPIGKS